MELTVELYKVSLTFEQMSCTLTMLSLLKQNEKKNQFIPDVTLYLFLICIKINQKCFNTYCFTYRVPLWLMEWFPPQT